MTDQCKGLCFLCTDVVPHGVVLVLFVVWSVDVYSNFCVLLCAYMFAVYIKAVIMMMIWQRRCLLRRKDSLLLFLSSDNVFKIKCGFS